MKNFFLFMALIGGMGSAAVAAEDGPSSALVNRGINHPAIQVYAETGDSSDATDLLKKAAAIETTLKTHEAAPKAAGPKVPIKVEAKPANDTSAPKTSPASESKKSAAKSVKEMVKARRQERSVKMPYLEKRLIQEMISPRSAQDESAFIKDQKPRNLQDIQQRAIRSNTQAKAAWEKMSLSRRKILVAIRNLFPEASYELIDKGGDLSGLNFNSGSYRFKLRQPVFHGGMLWNTFLQGKAEMEAAENEYDAVLGELVRDVSKAYFDYDRAKQQLRDYEEASQRLKKYRDISAKKYQENIISEIENLNAQSLYGDVEFGRENAQQELELAKLELQKFLNLPLDSKLEVIPLYNVQEMISKEEGVTKSTKVFAAHDLFSLPGGLTEVAVDHLVDLAYLHRPELRVEAAKLEAAQMVQKIKFGKFLPQADVTLEMGRLGEAYDFRENDPKWRQEFRCMLELNWNAGGNKIGYTYDNDQRAPSVTELEASRGTNQFNNKLSFGLLDGLNDFVESKQAEVQKLEQVVELEKAEKKVIQDVKQAYFDYQKNEIQLRSLLQKVNYRKRLAQLKQHELDQNQSQISEFLEAERDMLDELAKLHKSVSDYLAARATLNYAIGVPEYLKFGDEK